jgi:hypothetical protein
VCARILFPEQQEPISAAPVSFAEAESGEAPQGEPHLLQSKEDGDGTYDGQIGRAYLHLDDGSTGDEGQDLGLLTLSQTAELARRHDAEIDVDGPTREEWDAPPRRSLLDRLRGR